jgi:hypothetical protein
MVDANAIKYTYLVFNSSCFHPMLATIVAERGGKREELKVTL